MSHELLTKVLVRSGGGDGGCRTGLVAATAPAVVLTAVSCFAPSSRGVLCRRRRERNSALLPHHRCGDGVAAQVVLPHQHAVAANCGHASPPPARRASLLCLELGRLAATTAAGAPSNREEFIC